MTSGPAISKREQNRVEQRQRILHAAQVLFATRGLDGVTMAEVAELAGVARATVFNYFPSKYTLVESITEDVLAYYRAMLEKALADEVTSTPTLVRALFAHMGAGVETYHSFYRGVFREIVKIQVGLDEGGAAQRTREAALHSLERLLARGQQRGELSAKLDAEDLAVAFDSIANGTIVHWLYDEASGSLRERMERASEIFLGPVVLDPEAALSEPVPELAPVTFEPPGVAAGLERVP